MVVVVKTGGKILRENNLHEVILPFGSEYSLYFKNLESRRALIKVSIDGSDVLDYNSIIIPSNTEFELLGFLKDNDVKNRFKFIKKTQEIVDYRGDKIDDGIIRVEYTFEKVVWYQPVIRCDPYPGYRWGEGGYYSCNNSGSSTIKNAGLTSEVYGVGGCTNILNAAAESTFTCCSNSLNVNSAPKQINQDEGITVKGSQTEQHFYNGHFGCQEESRTIVIHLKGTDSKNIEVVEPITVKTKIKCETCGKMNKSYANFCSQCGTGLK
jgi:hypothetical protein